MGLLRQNTTGSYKLIFRVYDPVRVGKKIEVGLSTKHPDEAKYRAMVVMRALHLSGLALTPSLNVAIVATGKDGEEQSCAVNQEWIDRQIYSCYCQLLEQAKDDRIRELERQLRKVRAQKELFRDKLYRALKKQQATPSKETA